MIVDLEVGSSQFYQSTEIVTRIMAFHVPSPLQFSGNRETAVSSWPLWNWGSFSMDFYTLIGLRHTCYQ